ncbi:rod shape-determining protein MreD [Seohaeicola nanhaiensis]|uniref:Rod shape-determining protein MreD n=1 Tax=Seohaeicola nanhaiensis TaxID=1387282 RepID=A0ABV9KIV4_9RHOB
MAEPAGAHVWSMRIAFALLAMAIVFFHLIPLDTVPPRWAPPDLLMAFAFAWVLRRPEFVPPLLLAVVMLLADLLFQRPPGLQAMLVVMGAEYLKYRTAGLSESTFLREWATVALVITGVTLLNRLFLGMTLVPLPAFGLALIQMILTVATYPVVALVTRSVMGVRRQTPGDAGGLGARG